MKQKIIASMDQHGRILIPADVRASFYIKPGDKISIEVYENELKIVNASKVIDEMNAIFTKNRADQTISKVDEFISTKREEYKLEEKRNPPK
jgi:AbrB family looped-hinge helix DNA binding protein